MGPFREGGLEKDVSEKIDVAFPGIWWILCLLGTGIAFIIFCILLNIIFKRLSRSFFLECYCSQLSASWALKRRCSEFKLNAH